ncbi:MAG: hypothetical protein ACI9G1_001093 [Pirellulaceae bacterium]|jgi:hypothetical protein
MTKSVGISLNGRQHPMQSATLLLAILHFTSAVDAAFGLMKRPQFFGRDTIGDIRYDKLGTAN